MATTGLNRVAADITVGPTEIWLAPYGTVIPAPVTTDLAFDANFDSPGYTKTGIEVIYTPTISGIPVDEEMSDVRKYLSGEKLEVKFTLAQATLVNLNYALVAGTVETIGSDTRISIGSGLNAALKEWSLIGKSSLSNGGTRIFVAYRLTSTGAVSELTSGKTPKEYAISFEGLADSAYAAGKRLAYWQDFPSGVTS